MPLPRAWRRDRRRGLGRRAAALIQLDADYGDHIDIVAPVRDLATDAGVHEGQTIVRSSRLSTLPVGLRGNSSRNTTALGTL